ncbi:MAG: nicotinate (nicotinamide) nucleotide adenylyltransferase [Eubacteriales bacterium]|nr:nicotinate (nicotinamide) nucleotide adenylyltransferase [Eubacteriales bacterium]
MSNIIVLGGTFNPIHCGHIRLAVEAHETYGLPVLIMPCNDPSSYKSDKDIVAALHRIAMAEIATSPYDYMQVSTLEVERSGRTFTADTLQQLQSYYNKIYFIIGADSFFALPKWYKPEYICTNCQLLVAGRDRHSETEMQNQKDFLEKHFHARIDFLNTPNMPYSSTAIRNSVKCNKDISSMVPEGIAAYIKEHRLYC